MTLDDALKQMEKLKIEALKRCKNKKKIEKIYEDGKAKLVKEEMEYRVQREVSAYKIKADIESKKNEVMTDILECKDVVRKKHLIMELEILNETIKLI